MAADGRAESIAILPQPTGSQPIHLQHLQLSAARAALYLSGATLQAALESLRLVQTDAAATADELAGLRGRASGSAATFEAAKKARDEKRRLVFGDLVTGVSSGGSAIPTASAPGKRKQGSGGLGPTDDATAVSALSSYSASGTPRLTPTSFGSSPAAVAAAQLRSISASSSSSGLVSPTGRKRRKVERAPVFNRRDPDYADDEIEEVDEDSGRSDSGSVIVATRTARVTSTSSAPVQTDGSKSGGAVWVFLVTSGAVRAGDELTYEGLDASRHRLEVLAPAPGSSLLRVQAVDVRSKRVCAGPSEDPLVIVRAALKLQGRAATGVMWRDRKLRCRGCALYAMYSVSTCRVLYVIEHVVWRWLCCLAMV